MKKRKHNLIQIFEHQTLRVGEERMGAIFTEQHWKYLLQLNENQYPPYFQIIHNGIKALHYVGCIRLPGLTLEILPKTDANETESWQVFFLDMLQACGKIPVTRIPASLSVDQGKMSDFFIAAFLSEVEKLCSTGLVKKYRRVSRNEHKFSGKLLLHEHIKRNYVHKERVFAEHQLYDTHHVLHEVIREALTVSKTIIDHPESNYRVHKLLSFFPDQSTKVDLSILKKLKLTREDSRYEATLAWATFILQYLSPQMKYGKLSTPCFMIDMQQLFEEYVALQLKQAAPLFGCKIQTQAKSRFWRQRSIRPDMVLSTAEGETIILDTKWKMLKKGQPDDADLKQIFIYNQFFSARRGILLYPAQCKSANYASTYHQPKGASLSCEVTFIELMDYHSHALSRDWAKELLEQIMNKEIA